MNMNFPRPLTFLCVTINYIGLNVMVFVRKAPVSCLLTMAVIEIRARGALWNYYIIHREAVASKHLTPALKQALERLVNATNFMHRGLHLYNVATFEV